MGGDKGKGMDMDDIISRLLDAGYSGKIAKNICLRNNEILYICQTAREIFLSQPALIELNAPVKIVGDIHGQYTDLLRMFEMCGFPPSANFLFMGDYVDRGKMSLETILLLFCYKIKYPENFFLLRGNHECANVTKGKVKEKKKRIEKEGSTTPLGHVHEPFFLVLFAVVVLCFEQVPFIHCFTVFHGNAKE